MWLTPKKARKGAAEEQKHKNYKWKTNSKMVGLNQNILIIILNEYKINTQNHKK